MEKENYMRDRNYIRYKLYNTQERSILMLLNSFPAQRINSEDSLIYMIQEGKCQVQILHPLRLSHFAPG